MVGDAPLVFMGCGVNANFFFFLKCGLHAYAILEQNVPSVLFTYKNATVWGGEMIQVSLDWWGRFLSPRCNCGFGLQRYLFLIQPR